MLCRGIIWHEKEAMKKYRIKMINNMRPKVLSAMLFFNTFPTHDTLHNARFYLVEKTRWKKSCSMSASGCFRDSRYKFKVLIHEILIEAKTLCDPERKLGKTFNLDLLKRTSVIRAIRVLGWKKFKERF